MISSVFPPNHNDCPGLISRETAENILNNSTNKLNEQLIFYFLSEKYLRSQIQNDLDHKAFIKINFLH